MFRRILVTGFVTAAAAVALVAAPAQASGALHELTLTVSEGDTVIPDRTVTLTCDPDGGTHPNAVAACDVLRTVGGDIENMNVNPGIMCPQVYNPYTVTAHGHYFKRSVNVVKTYGNACELGAQTGPFYGF